LVEYLVELRNIEATCMLKNYMIILIF